MSSVGVNKRGKTRRAVTEENAVPRRIDLTTRGKWKRLTSWATAAETFVSSSKIENAPRLGSAAPGKVSASQSSSRICQTPCRQNDGCCDRLTQYAWKRFARLEMHSRTRSSWLAVEQVKKNKIKNPNKTKVKCIFFLRKVFPTAESLRNYDRCRWRRCTAKEPLCVLAPTIGRKQSSIHPFSIRACFRVQAGASFSPSDR